MTLPFNFIYLFYLFIFYLFIFFLPGAVARSEMCPLGMQAAPSSIPTSGTFFRGDMVKKWKKNSMVILLLLIQEEQLSVTGERM